MNEETPKEILQRACNEAIDKALGDVRRKDPKAPSADVLAWAAFFMHKTLFSEAMKHLQALEARVAEIEAKGVEYKGVYQAA